MLTKQQPASASTQWLEGVRLEGPPLPEPVEVITTISTGASIILVARGLRTNQVQRIPLDEKQIGMLAFSAPARHFSMDARAVVALGRESIKEHTTALMELVKNGYDADASVVEVEVHAAGGKKSEAYIRISDDGCGMSDDDIARKWLRIGYSEKRTNRHTKSARRKTGEKGVGRISADRLGCVLELRSQAKSAIATGLKVTWERFDREDVDLHRVDIDDLGGPEVLIFHVPQPSTSGTRGQIIPPPRKSASEVTGTELKIHSLRDDWRLNDVLALRDELAVFSSPFHRAPGFEIRLTTDLSDDVQGPVGSAFNELAEVEIRTLYREGREATFEIWDRDKAGKRHFVRKTSGPIFQLVYPGSSNPDRDLGCGPVEMRFLFLPRKATTLRATSLSLRDLREFMDKHAGVRIFRDGVRVKPYGDLNSAEGDWLQLGARKAQNPAGPGRTSFRLAPSQLVGAVFITRDENPKIADSSGREGLVAGEALEDLKLIALASIRALESHHHQRAQRSDPEEKSQPIEALGEVRQDLETLASTLKDVKKQTGPSGRRNVERSLDQLGLALQKIRQAEQSLEEAASQTSVFRGLATLGIAAAVFAHETEASVNATAAAVHAAKALLGSRVPSIDNVRAELEKALEACSKVSAWGKFALTRIRQDKRRRTRVDIESLSASLIESLRPNFEASQIALRSELQAVKGNTFAIDVESVLLNFLTNAYEFCRTSRRARVVIVSLKPKQVRGAAGFELSVGDTGLGVRPDDRKRIWEPLVTTRTGQEGGSAGTGLGLSIVQSVVDEHGGTRSVTKDPDLKGALFSVWLPLK